MTPPRWAMHSTFPCSWRTAFVASAEPPTIPMRPGYDANPPFVEMNSLFREGNRRQ